MVMRSVEPNSDRPPSTPSITQSPAMVTEISCKARSCKSADFKSFTLMVTKPVSEVTSLFGKSATKVFLLTSMNDLVLTSPRAVIKIWPMFWPATVDLTSPSM